MTKLDGWGDCLIGTTQRLNTPKIAVYSYALALRAVRDLPPGEAAARLTTLFAHQLPNPPLILMPMNRVRFWEKVQLGDVLRWEGLDDAIMGLGVRPGLPEVTVYSKPKAIDLLDELGEASDGRLPGLSMFQDKVEHAWLGPKTPFFIEPTE